MAADDHTPRRTPYAPELSAAAAAAADWLPARWDVRVLDALRERPSLGPTLDQLLIGRSVEYEDRIVRGSASRPDLEISIIRPRHAAESAPGVYYIHSGGMVYGKRQWGAQRMIELAESCGIVGVTIDYRLAPEHPHPAPVDDCYAGLVWVAANADELGIDRSRLVVMGTSAGGGLAAAVALLARDFDGPALAGQMLLCPMLDDRDQTISTMQYSGTGGWDREATDFGWRALLGDLKGGPDVSPYAAPARMLDLTGLPKTFIDVGSAEVFRDECIDYAARILAAGGQAELHVWSGGFHGFDSFMPDAAVSTACRAAQQSWLCRTLGITQA